MRMADVLSNQSSLLNQEVKNNKARGEAGPVIGYIGKDKIHASEVMGRGLPSSLERMLEGQSMVAYAFRYDWQRIGSRVSKMDYYGIQLLIERLSQELRSEMQTFHLERDLSGENLTTEQVSELAYQFSFPKCQFTGLPADRFGYTFYNVHITGEVIFKVQPSKQWWDVLVLCSELNSEQVLKKIRSNIPVVDLGPIRNYPFKWLFIPSTAGKPAFPFTINKFDIISYDCKSSENLIHKAAPIDLSLTPFFSLSNEKYLSLTYRDHSLKSSIQNHRQHSSIPWH